MTTGDLVNIDFGKGGFQFFNPKRFIPFSMFRFTNITLLGDGNIKYEFYIDFCVPRSKIEIFIGRETSINAVIDIRYININIKSIFLKYEPVPYSISRGYITTSQEEFEKFHNALHYLC